VSAEVTRIRESLDGLATLAGRVAAEQADAIAVIADRYEATLRGGGTLFFAGNGGSAADAQHVATEYVVRYQTNRPALRAVALTTDTRYSRLAPTTWASRKYSPGRSKPWPSRAICWCCIRRQGRVPT